MYNLKKEVCYLQPHCVKSLIFSGTLALDPGKGTQIYIEHAHKRIKH